ncbi:hypothetical protein [Halorhabdus sp. BNX81]|uniref:hypothetical protein n=1 Tax=Halorhabdus sp. BNX81 TaxID=2980181 RepID=UPI0023DD2D43|nr:hypothetical protein [Halorhabdus sp. BNX81]WEL20378.1 Cell surface protein [Halorhabdus sp. BNX81]
MNPRKALVVAVIVGLFVAGSGFTAGATTYGVFSDADTGTGSIQAAASFDVPGDGPCVDTNGNGECNPGDAPVDPDELRTFDNASADLVIPASVGDISTKKADISITANTITSEVDLTTKNARIDLHAGGGGIDLAGTNLTRNGGNGAITLHSAGPVTLSNAGVSTKGTVAVSADAGLDLDGINIDTNKEITLRARTISAHNAVLTSKTRDIVLGATRMGGGALTASGAAITVEGGNGQVTLESVGNMSLDEATITTANRQPTANLTSSEAILDVTATEILGKYTTIAYTPANVTIEPPDSESVVG